jgi:mRNA interferase HigB
MANDLEDDIRPPRKNHLISRKKVREFIESHPEHAKHSEVLYDWCKTLELATWEKFADVRKTFPSADHVGKFVVFNVGGNKFRFIAEINYQGSPIFLRHVLTHSEYDKEKWKS